jgi:hypothetical protein
MIPMDWNAVVESVKQLAGKVVVVLGAVFGANLTITWAGQSVPLEWTAFVLFVTNINVIKAFILDFIAAWNGTKSTAAREMKERTFVEKYSPW